MRIRRAGPTDLLDLVELRAVMFAAMGASPQQLAEPSWRHSCADWFAARLPRSTFVAFVAEVDNQAALREEERTVTAAVACGEVTDLAPSPFVPSGQVGLLFNIATHSAYRRRGLAAGCTDGVLSWFVEETDVERVDLFATPSGRPLYEARGFLECPDPAMRWRVPRA